MPAMHSSPSSRTPAGVVRAACDAAPTARWSRPAARAGRRRRHPLGGAPPAVPGRRRAALFRPHAVARDHRERSPSWTAARCSWPATRTRSSSPTRSREPLRRQGRSLINWIAELRVPDGAPPATDWNKRVDKSRLRASLRRLEMGLDRHPGADRGRSRDLRIPAGRPRPAAALDGRPRDAARRRRAPDVPDRLQRQRAGHPRRALPGRLLADCAARGGDLLYALTRIRGRAPAAHRRHRAAQPPERPRAGDADRRGARAGAASPTSTT